MELKCFLGKKHGIKQSKEIQKELKCLLQRTCIDSNMRGRESVYVREGLK